MFQQLLQPGEEVSLQSRPFYQRSWCRRQWMAQEQQPQLLDSLAISPPGASPGVLCQDLPTDRIVPFPSCPSRMAQKGTMVLQPFSSGWCPNVMQKHLPWVLLVSSVRGAQKSKPLPLKLKAGTKVRGKDAQTQRNKSAAS